MYCRNAPELYVHGASCDAGCSRANGLSTVRTFSAAPVAAESISQVVSAREPLWLANRAVAEAYGLGPDDFEHILSTFPVFAHKRPEFFAYLLERLAE